MQKRTLFKIIEHFKIIFIRSELLGLKMQGSFKNYHPKIGQQFMNNFINIQLLGLRKNARLAESITLKYVNSFSM